VLRALYAKPDGVLASHFRVFLPEGQGELWLDLFLPMDEEAVAPDGIRLPAGAVAFADDEHGDPYVFVPEDGPDDDGPVFLRRQDPEGEVMVLIAPALSAFLGWERRQSA
jgi:hypothetical protein